MSLHICGFIDPISEDEHRLIDVGMSFRQLTLVDSHSFPERKRSWVFWPGGEEDHEVSWGKNMQTVLFYNTKGPRTLTRSISSNHDDG